MTEIEEYLDQIPMWASKKNSLKDIRAYLEELGNPDESMKIIHVAGTNGKGSVCSYLTAVLTEAGYKVGTFISPHLEHVRERFLMNGELVREDTYERAFYRVKKLSETMTARGYLPPTYFEFLFYMSMVINEQCKPDFVVLETGLGGRLDVTNVIRKPQITVLTSISMDHMQYLGNTIEEIAGEKAGILKAEVPVIYDSSCQESNAVVERWAKELGCPMYPVANKDYTFMRRDVKGTLIAVRTTDGGQLVLTVPSQAEYQMMNVTVAVRAICVLRRKGELWISPEDIIRGIKRSYWPGRMEQVAENVYLDGAHNAGGVEALNRTIRRMQQETGKKVILMFGAVSDKDHHQMIQKLCEGVTISQVIIAHMDSKRCAETQQLAEEFRALFQEAGRCDGVTDAETESAGGAKPSGEITVRVFPTVREAWNHFLREKGDDLAFCAGSLYLVGEVKTLLKEEDYD